MTGTSRIGIVGGAIGGLTAAIAIAQTKRFDEIIVYDRAPAEAAAHTNGRARGRGAALLVWSNAVSALSSIGLGNAVTAASAALHLTEVRSKDGLLLSRLPIGEWSEPFGAPTVVIRRPVLLDILERALDATPSVVLRMGSVLRSYDLRNGGGRRGGVRLVFEDGTTEHVDALIGADGLDSTVRRQLLGEETSRLAGYDAWVGITPSRPDEIQSGVATATIGHGPRFWTAALRDGAVFWYATLPPRIGRDVRDRATLADLFSDWPAPIRELVASTPEPEIIRTRIRARRPVEDWGAGPITLLGDAAHPSTPDLGQGACQAIESAVVLGECVRDTGDIGDAFRAYERKRMPRTAAISRLSWMTSFNSSIESAVMCRMRDAAIRVGLESMARTSLRWILAGHRDEHTRPQDRA